MIFHRHLVLDLLCLPDVQLLLLDDDCLLLRTGLYHLLLLLLGVQLFTTLHSVSRIRSLQVVWPGRVMLEVLVCLDHLLMMERWGMLLLNRFIPQTRSHLFTHQTS